MAPTPVFGSTSYKANFPSTSNLAAPSASPAIGPGLSTALDARLECGLETKAEIRLRKMLSLQMDTLQGAFTAPLPMPPANGHSTIRSQQTPTDDELADSVSTGPQVCCMKADDFYCDWRFLKAKHTKVVCFPHLLKGLRIVLVKLCSPLKCLRSLLVKPCSLLKCLRSLLVKPCSLLKCLCKPLGQTV